VYSGYNYLAYDIGNHFNEFAGVSEVDYNLYPSRKLQEQWLRSYLEAYKEYKGFGTDVTEKEVEVLYVQVNQFALASHFFWGLWALIQAKYSTIDFDFLGYAVVRFNQYFKMKNEVMALKLPE